FLETVDPADVGMIERGEHPRFALEAREPIRVARKRMRQDLDRDVAPKLRVSSAVDLAHAAHTEKRLQMIPADRHTHHSWGDGSGYRSGRYRDRRFSEEAIIRV